MHTNNIYTKYFYLIGKSMSFPVKYKKSLTIHLLNGQRLFLSSYTGIQAEKHQNLVYTF